MSRVWDLPCESHTQKLVLLALADNANDQGKCWPSVSTIARKCQLSRRSVFREIIRLEKAKLLRSESGGGRKSNHYSLTITGDNLSPVTTCHRTHDRESPPPVTTCHPSGDNRSPKPSENHQVTIKGKEDTPRLFPNEYRDLIKDAESEIESIKGRGILSDSDRAEIKGLRGKITEWKKKRFSQ